MWKNDDKKLNPPPAELRRAELRRKPNELDYVRAEATTGQSPAGAAGSRESNSKTAGLGHVEQLKGNKERGFAINVACNKPKAFARGMFSKFYPSPALRAPSPFKGEGNKSAGLGHVEGVKGSKGNCSGEGSALKRFITQKDVPSSPLRVPSPAGRRKKLYAFTLSETLIALVIIGIVAALTVPVIAQHAQKRELVERLKKNYALFTEVTNKITAEEGSPQHDWGTPSRAYPRYKQHLSVIKDCGTGSGCMSQGAYKTLNGGGTTNWDTRTTFYKMVLADGTQVIFSSDNANNNCDTQNYPYGGDNNVCMAIDVDVNGERKPNQIGRDVFKFSLKPDGLHPMGCDNPQCVGTSGYGCACRVLRENAINY